MSEEPQLGTCDATTAPHPKNAWSWGACKNWQPLPTDRATEPECGCPTGVCWGRVTDPKDCRMYAADTPRPPLEGEGPSEQPIDLPELRRLAALRGPYPFVDFCRFAVESIDTLSAELAATRAVVEAAREVNEAWCGYDSFTGHESPDDGQDAAEMYAGFLGAVEDLCSAVAALSTEAPS